MQIARRVLQQKIEQRDGGGIRQPLQLVECEHEGAAERRDRLQHEPGPALRPAACLVGLGPVRDIQPRALAGEGNAGVENPGLVLLVQRNPRRGHAVPGEAPAAFRKQRGLAETAGRHQHRHATLGRQRQLDQFAAVKISRRPLGHADLLQQQKGQLLFGGRRPAAFGILAGLAHRSSCSAAHMENTPKTAGPLPRRWRSCHPPPRYTGELSTMELPNL